MEKRKKTWETEYMCKDVLIELVEAARIQATRMMIRNLILEMVYNASGVVEEIRDLILELVKAAENEGGFQVLVKEVRQRGWQQMMIDTLTV